jgi:hypothetical protein
MTIINGVWHEFQKLEDLGEWQGMVCHGRPRDSNKRGTLTSESARDRVFGGYRIVFWRRVACHGR